MDFEVSVNQEKKVFEQYHDVLKFIDGKMAYWNNFEPHLGLHIHIVKIQSKTDTLGVNANDEFKISENIS